MYQSNICSSTKDFRQPLHINPRIFDIRFKQRFKYHIDSEKKLLAFQVKGLFSDQRDVDYLSSVIIGVCTAFETEELNFLVDHRDMKTPDGEIAVYSPEIAERAVVFQQELLKNSK